MFIIDAIDPMIFFISLAIGLFFGYVTAKTPRIVFKYPTPYNSEKIVYTDRVGNCYKYKASETKCPADIKKITPVIFD
jgi:hypothetical protein